MLSCETKTIPNGYVKFQTFDEYTLKGVSSSTEKIKSPFVYIRQVEDTISVIESKENKEYQYTRNKDYWYCFYKKEHETELNYKCDSTPLYIEKFIFNDTILTLTYYKEGENIFNERLTIATKDKLVHISFNISNKTDSLFNEIKELADTYLTVIPYYKRGLEYQSSYYIPYTKKIKKNYLYLYRNDDKDSIQCLYDIFSLNSLGEFDFELYKRSIYNENQLKDENWCP